MAVSLFPFLAEAETPTPPAGGEPSVWGNVFWAIFPLIILIAFFVFFIRRMQKPILKRTQDHMARQIQHMERVEQLLERIAKSVERKD